MASPARVRQTLPARTRRRPVRHRIRRSAMTSAPTGSRFRGRTSSRADRRMDSACSAAATTRHFIGDAARDRQTQGAEKPCSERGAAKLPISSPASCPEHHLQMIGQPQASARSSSSSGSRRRRSGNTELPATKDWKRHAPASSRRPRPARIVVHARGAHVMIAPVHHAQPAFARCD
jgi:hypothetical protein